MTRKMLKTPALVYMACGLGEKSGPQKYLALAANCILLVIIKRYECFQAVL